MFTNMIAPDFTETYRDLAHLQKERPGNFDRGVGVYHQKYTGDDFAIVSRINMPEAHPADESSKNSRTILLSVWNGRNPLAEIGEFITEVSKMQQFS